jgi:hypothetical protein
MAIRFPGLVTLIALDEAQHLVRVTARLNDVKIDTGIIVLDTPPAKSTTVELEFAMRELDKLMDVNVMAVEPRVPAKPTFGRRRPNRWSGQ